MADERHEQRETGSGNEVPPWLRGVPLPARPPSPPSTSSASAASVPVSELPDWLRDLQATLGDTESDEAPSEAAASDEPLPDWLSSLAAETTPSPMPPSAPQVPTRGTTDEGVPDWLRELGPAAHDDTSAPSELTAPAEDQALPHWLQEQSRIPSEPLPPVEPPPPAPPASRSALRMPSGATDWLRSLGEEPAADAPPLSSQPLFESPVNDDDAIPSWLRDISSEELERDLAAQTTSNDVPSVADSPEPPDLPPVNDDDAIPSWLRDISSDELERDLANATSDAQPSPDTSFSSGETSDIDAPQWLASANDDEQRTDDSLPSWLQSAAAPPLAHDDHDEWRGSPSDGAAEQQSFAAEMPDWLKAASEPASGESLAADDVRAEQQPPDWLQQTDINERHSEQHEEHDESGPALPDWLRDEAAADQSATASFLPMHTDAFELRQEDAIPPWLQENDASDTSSAPASHSTRGEPQDALPDWLRSTAADQDVPQMPTPEESDQDATDLPDWLRMDAPADTRHLQTPAQPSHQGEDLPDWLRTEPPVPQAPTPPTTDRGPDDVPDWLRADAPVADEQQIITPPQDTFPSSATPFASAPDMDDVTTSPGQHSGDDLPDWLRSDTPTTPHVPSPPSSAGLPDWLEADVPQSRERDAGLPDWLRGANADAPVRTPPAAPPPVPSEDTSALPPWLRDEQATGETQREGAPSGSDFLGLGGTDLPGWLRSSDAPTPGTADVTAPGETYSDWLARLKTQQDEDLDVDAAAVDQGIVPVLFQRPTYAVQPARMPAIALLQRLVAEPFAATPYAPAPATVRPRQYAGLERILYLLLFAALVVGLAVPGLTQPLQGPLPAAGAEELARSIDTLGENDVVLVAYEWDVRRRGELAPLEQAVINHLAERHVKFVFVSTDLQGTLLSFDARDRLINQFGYRTKGLDYVLLGYKPGGELGLRQMAQNLPRVLASDFQGADANQSAVALDVASGQPRLNSIRDFAMVVVMADDAQDVQGWMEQVRSQMTTDKPLVLLMPAETTPIVQPYLQMPGVFSLSGRLGALAYDERRGGAASNAALAASGQVPFAIVSFIALVILGALVSAIIAATRRRRSA